MPTLGATPQVQLDSLPLITAQQVGDPGEVVVIGNSIIKHWTPAQLGVVAVSGNTGDPDKAGALGFVTNIIDVRGCSFFRLVMVRRTDALIHDQTTNLNISWQMKGTSNGTSQGVTPRTGDGGRISWPQVGVLSPGVGPAAVGYPFDSVCSVGFSNALLYNAGVAPPHAIVGAGRFFFWNDAPGANAAFWNWWAELWGQSA
jgi:hypothetical protein